MRGKYNKYNIDLLSTNIIKKASNKKYYLYCFLLLFWLTVLLQILLFLFSIFAEWSVIELTVFVLIT